MQLDVSTLSAEDQKRVQEAKPHIADYLRLKNKATELAANKTATETSRDACLLRSEEMLLEDLPAAGLPAAGWTSVDYVLDANGDVATLVVNE